MPRITKSQAKLAAALKKQFGASLPDKRAALAPPNCSALTLEQLQTIVRRDLKNICCIYRTVGAAFFQEAEDRLVQRIAHSIHDAQNGKLTGSDQR